MYIFVLYVNKGMYVCRNVYTPHQNSGFTEAKIRRNESWRNLK